MAAVAINKEADKRERNIGQKGVACKRNTSYKVGDHLDNVTKNN